MTHEQIQALIDADPNIRHLLTTGDRRYAMARVEDYIRTQRPDIAAARQALDPNLRVNESGQLFHWDNNNKKGALAVGAIVGGLATGLGAAGAFTAPAAASTAAGGGGTAAATGAGTYIPGAEAGLPAALAAENAHGVMPPPNFSDNSVWGTGVPKPGPGGDTPQIPAWLKAALAGSGGLATLFGPGGAFNAGDQSDPLGPGTADLMKEIQAGLSMQRHRMEQAGPVYDTLVNMAYGNTPSRYRGAAPAGYPAAATEAPSGAYAYQPPRFGGTR